MKCNEHYLCLNSANGRKGMTVIECAVGFSVVPHLITGKYIILTF